jgi:hypothetical protein
MYDNDAIITIVPNTIANHLIPGTTYAPIFWLLYEISCTRIRLRANYAARVLHARVGENTHDEQLRIAWQIKMNKELFVNKILHS